MKPIIIAASLFVVGTASWLLFKSEPISEPNSEPDNADIVRVATVGTATALDRKLSVSRSDISEDITLQRRVDDLTVALEEVVAERSSAEILLQEAEQDIASLERFIEEIEERGEDPMDYAEEGLAMFHPAANAYQDALDQLQLAQSKEKSAAMALAGAKNKLADFSLDEDSK
ncbi:MAG: hypothetical protein AB8B81_06455 [Halioglobus sp.]